MKIYIAGAHRELERCSAIIDTVKKFPNVEITLDWTYSIRKFGGDQQDDRSVKDRAETAWQDVDAVLNADLVWLLLPRAITKGMHTELGVALAFRRLRPFLSVPDRFNGKKTLIASWADKIAARDEDLPLFVCAADNIFDTDEEALGAVRDLCAAA